MKDNGDAGRSRTTYLRTVEPEIMSQYTAGASSHVIGGSFGLTPEDLDKLHGHHYREFGTFVFEWSEPGATEQERNIQALKTEIVALYADGASSQAIRERLGLTDKALDNFHRSYYRAFQAFQSDFATAARKIAVPRRKCLNEDKKRVAVLFSVGKTKRQIAEELLMTLYKVKYTICSIYDKLGVSCRLGLALVIDSSGEVVHRMPRPEHAPKAADIESRLNRLTDMATRFALHLCDELNDDRITGYYGIEIKRIRACEELLYSRLGVRDRKRLKAVYGSRLACRRESLLELVDVKHGRRRSVALCAQTSPV